MSYQKCPVCSGSGSVPSPFDMCSGATCPTCRGSRIIDEFTGLPPYSAEPITTTSTSSVVLKFDKDGNLTDHNGDKIQSSYTVN